MFCSIVTHFFEYIRVFKREIPFIFLSLFLIGGKLLYSVVLASVCARARVCVCVWVAQSCLTLCDPIYPTKLLYMEFSRQEYWSGLPGPSPGDLPHPEIEPSSPTLQAVSSPPKLQGKAGFYCTTMQISHNNTHITFPYPTALGHPRVPGWTPSVT